MFTKQLSTATVFAAGVLASVVVASPAAADCTSSAGVTLCSQGDVRGSNTGDGPSGSSGPYYPYPCEYDYLCDDYGVGVVFDLNPPNFDRPDRPPGGRGGGRR